MYKFDVNISENEYLEFNKFVSLKSAYGKKQMRKCYLWLFLLVAALCALALFANGFTEDALIDCIAYAIVYGLVILLLKPLTLLIIKMQIKFVKKNGKMPYSSKAVMEFGDEGFTERTDEEKTEIKYSGVDRVSVLPNRFIYIHKNQLMAYILPYASFQDESQSEEFLSFLKEKVSRIDIYESKK